MNNCKHEPEPGDGTSKREDTVDLIVRTVWSGTVAAASEGEDSA